MLGACTTKHHFLYTIRFKKNIMIWLNRILKRLISHNLCFTLHERLKSIDYRVEILFCYFRLSFCHVIRLLAIKWIRDAARYEHVKLNALFAFLLFEFVALGELCGIFLFTCEWRWGWDWTCEGITSDIWSVWCLRRGGWVNSRTVG